MAIFTTSSTHSANRLLARRSDGGGIAPNHASGERPSFPSTTSELDVFFSSSSSRAFVPIGVVADAVAALRRRPPPSPETAEVSLRSAASRGVVEPEAAALGARQLRGEGRGVSG